RIVDVMGPSQDDHLGRDADVVADGEAAADVECAVAIDPRISADADAKTAGITQPPEPDIRAHVHARVLAELNAQDAPIPEMAKFEAGPRSHDVVREVVEYLDDELSGCGPQATGGVARRP